MRGGARASLLPQKEELQANSPPRHFARTMTETLQLGPGVAPLSLANADGVHFDPLNTKMFSSSASSVWEAVAATWGGGPGPPQIRVLDLGCGNGVWGLILHRLAPPGATVHVTFADVDPEAAALSLRNAAANGVAAAACCARAGDMLGALPAGEAPFDLVVFNPPQTGGDDAFRTARPDKWGGYDGALYYQRLASESAALRAKGTVVAVAKIGLASPGAVAEAFRREGLEMAAVFEHTREFLRSGMEAIAPGLFDWQLAARARGEAEFAIDGEDAAAPCAAGDAAATRGTMSQRILLGVQADAALSAAQVSRYGRQLIIPQVGPRGQRAICGSSVLVVGAGGLGSPALLYLAGAGVQRVGVCDFDKVERSNLHRQVIHTEARVGMSKALSACAAMRALNSSVQAECHDFALDASNAVEVIGRYDVVLDATDNSPSRYLLSDACVVAGKPLVSGAAIQMEGQLTVYNHDGGPCYRCLFPQPAPPDGNSSCSDRGVLGVVPGIIGNLMALEAIKLCGGVSGGGTTAVSRRMLMFDALDCSFRDVRLPPRDAGCAVCSAAAREAFGAEALGGFDYAAFCGGGAAAPEAIPAQCELSAADFAALLERRDRASAPLQLLDVRPPVQFSICALPGAANVPLHQLRRDAARWAERVAQGSGGSEEERMCYVMCRRGVDSRRAVAELLRAGAPAARLRNVAGGMEAMAQAGAGVAMY